MPVKPSFTDEVKAELANVQPARPCCQEAELAAMVEALAGPGAGAPMTLRIPRNAVARKVVHLARIAGGQVEAVRKGPTEKRPTYRLRLLLPAGRGSADPCCARAILRGAFLARGVLVIRPMPTISRSRHRRRATCWRRARPGRASR